MAKKKVIVIGGGAAGLIAAGQSALAGSETIIFEKKYRPGRKLRITGKGRCNLTNIAPLPEFLDHFNAGSKFLRQTFNNFFSEDLVQFFGEIGIATELERGGRVFPENNDARLVVDAVEKWVRECGVEIITDSPVEVLITDKNNIAAVMLKNGKEHRADAVILATGGKSYPATGSTGDGYLMAESVGHTIIPARPSLVPIETAGDIALRLQGLSLKNVNVSLWIDGKKRDEKFGEMLFTHFGLSGPIILTLSRQIVDALLEGQKIELSIDLKPALDEVKLDQRLLRDLDKHGKQKFQTLLKDLLPKKLIPVCYDLTGIGPSKEAHQITSNERKRLRQWLKNFRFDVSGSRDFNEAIITAGGVSTKEIDPRTMESKLVRGLYFAGEIMDIDADTGGYNLQAAFSTGWLAGISAAK